MSLSAATAQRWCEEAIARLGRDAGPSDGRFPTRGALVAGAPESVLEAQTFYRDACFDWGSAWTFRFEIEGEDLFVVYAATDGDAAWVELFDARGVPLATGSLGEQDRVFWEPKEAARARVATGEMP